MSQTEIPDVGTRESTGHHGGYGRERKSFWSSMPGILTALGGLVTAVGTVAAFYFGAVGGGDGNGGGSSSSGSSGYTTPVAPAVPQVIVLTQPAAQAPVNISLSGAESSRAGGVVSGDTVSATSDADQIIEAWASELDAGTAAVAEGCGMGYADDCDELLDTLAYDCYDGYALSCDVLFLASPAGSDLAEYGDTCGGRMGTGNDSWCRDLVSS